MWRTTQARRCIPIWGFGCLLPASAFAVVVRTPAELTDAVAKAVPGDSIFVMPGAYNLSRPLLCLRPGPVLLSGVGRPEEVQIRVQGQSAVVVGGDRWTLGKMTLQGVAGVRVDPTGSGVTLRALRIVDSSVGVDLGDETDLACSLGQVVLENNIFVRVGQAIRLGSVCSAEIRHQTTWATDTAFAVLGPSQAPVLRNNLFAGKVAFLGPNDLTLGAGSSAWFVAPGKDDFHLSAQGPIDRGLASSTTEDADGVRRPNGLAPDPGAYEYVEKGNGGGKEDAGSGDGGTAGAFTPGGGGGYKGKPQEGLSCSFGPHKSTSTGPVASLLALLSLCALWGLRRLRS